MFSELENEEMEKMGENIQAAEDQTKNSESYLSEISERRWSVVTYDSIAVSGVTYNEALEWIKNLDSQKVSGLCIVTDEAAARINKN